MLHAAFPVAFPFGKVVLLYFILVSATSFVLTCYDKLISKRNGPRVPEKVLLLVAGIGGELVMYLTMRLIHHKTHHQKFMVGLPVLVLLHLILVIGYVFLFS